MLVGVIGPTNLEKLSMLMGKPVSFLLEKAEIVGKIIAEGQHELWVNADVGMIEAVASAYKKYGGLRLGMLYPENPDPWPNAHTQMHHGNADLLLPQPDWFRSNYHVVSSVDVCVCVGLSSGTLSELAYIKWDKQFNTGKLQELVVIRELVRTGELPPEIALEIPDVLRYVEQAENLLIE